MKTIAIKASSFDGHTKLEDFHEFLLVCKDTFTKNLHSTKISTNKIFKNVTENKDLVVMSSDRILVLLNCLSQDIAKYVRQWNY